MSSNSVTKSYISDNASIADSKYGGAKYRNSTTQRFEYPRKGGYGGDDASYASTQKTAKGGSCGSNAAKANTSSYATQKTAKGGSSGSNAAKANTSSYATQKTAKGGSSGNAAKANTSSTMSASKTK
jgi:hypothetical protein